MDPLVDEVVAIPLSDLQIIRAALNSAYHHSTVLDLGEQYRKLQQRPQQSKLTASLHDALSLTLTYIELGQVEPEEEADEPTPAS